MLLLLSLNKLGKWRVLHFMNAEGCLPNTVDSPRQHDSLSGVFVSSEHIPLSAALALVEDRPASKARLGPCPFYILTHPTQKNILPGEDVRGVSFEIRGVGPGQDGATLSRKELLYVAGRCSVIAWTKGQQGEKCEGAQV
jgi:hypothetical protein